MNRWEEFQFEERIREILGDATGSEERPFGNPFFTPYQIAIEYAHRYREDFTRIGVPIGGRNTGLDHSLAQYIAAQLTRKILSGELPDFEGSYISNDHLHEISFDHNGQIIESSSTGTQHDLSLFRLVD